MTDLERALRDLGSHLDAPPGEGLAARVSASLRRPAPRRPVGWWRVAVAAAAAALGLALAGPAVADWLGIGAVRVRQEPAPAPALGGELDLGARVTSRVVARRAGFEPWSVGALDEETTLWLDESAAAPLVSVAYEPGPGLPEVRDTGVGAILMMVRGSLDQRLVLEKYAAGAQVEAATVDGAPALWIEGAHEVGTLDADGDVVVERLRLAANVVLWERDGITFRLETALDRAAALRLAESVRPE